MVAHGSHPNLSLYLKARIHVLDSFAAHIYNIEAITEEIFFCSNLMLLIKTTVI